MTDYTGVEWQGEPLTYGTIVSAPSRGIVAIVLTGMEGAMVNGWYSLRSGEHVVLVLDPGHGVFGKPEDDRPNIVWMQEWGVETIRWFVR